MTDSQNGGRHDSWTLQVLPEPNKIYWIVSHSSLMFVSVLTYACFQLISAIDQGKIISMEDVKYELESQHDIFEFLDKSLPDIFDFSILHPIDRDFFKAHYYDLALAAGPKKFGVENNGLITLLAYTVELIQRERRKLTEKGYECQLDVDPNT